MVRFIIPSYSFFNCSTKTFTFHYGQIYYIKLITDRIDTFDIYIPLWLDLLFFESIDFAFMLRIYIPLWLDLLSMRDISPAPNKYTFTFHYGQIYYSLLLIASLIILFYLHSTMVRFIMSMSFILSIIACSIYIPLWLDLLYTAIL